MEPFKNIYNEKEIKRLAKEIKLVDSSFRDIEFIDSLINESWEVKELKQRQRAITLALGEYLPPYLEALEILKKVEGKFSGLFHLIFPDFVELYGLDYYEESIQALKLFTKGCSSEFGVRSFLVKYPDFIEVFKIWAKDECEHVRRLASEGCRPRLPWGIALNSYKKDPSSVIEVLEILKDDKSKYVQKSVANNLNDISKDNPKIAKEVFKKWYGKSERTNWIVKHASRGLLKEGDREVLELFGYKSEHLNVSDFLLDKEVKLNEYLKFSFKISSQEPLGKLRIEYKIGLLRQKNKINYKVFKISERVVESNELMINKSHHFKEVTTRNYYDGIQTLSIVVNGREFECKEFLLKL